MTEGRTFTPTKTRAWESYASQKFRAGWMGGPLTEPIGVIVLALKSRPKRLMRKKDPDGRIWRTATPDIDNVLKAVCDALEKGGIVEDDRYIVNVAGSSQYTAKGERPHVEVTIYDPGGAP